MLKFLPTPAFVLLVALACDLAATSCEAQTSALSSPVGGNLGIGFSQTTRVGYRFTPSTDFTVTSLGIFDTQGDGLETDMEVALFQQTGEFTGLKLEGVTVPAGTGAPLIDGFRYVDLPTPIRLDPSETYQVATIFFSLFSSSGSEGYRSSSTFDTHPALTNVSWHAAQSDFLTEVGWVSSPFQSTVVGPNFLFIERVPEPTTFTLVLSALCMTLRRHR